MVGYFLWILFPHRALAGTDSSEVWQAPAVAYFEVCTHSNSW
jgi:hypothetical protein